MKSFIGFFLLVATLASCFLPIASGQTPTGGPPTITLDLSKHGAPISPLFYGLMTEEISHAYDGGLYAELIQNRVFKCDPEKLAHWSAIQDGGATATIALDQSQPLNDALGVSLKLNVPGDGYGRAGIANDGYWGIPVKRGTTYRASFYAKASGSQAGPLTVDIESNDGKTVYASATVPKITDQWRQYSVKLSTPADVQASATNRFVISTARAGIIWFDLVSLFPPTWNDRPNGNRVDLMQKLADMQPAFLRFPGGNYLEGNSIKDRYQWKHMIGDISTRPTHECCWGYHSSDGLGLLESLEWSEDLHVEPILAIYDGYSLREATPPGPAVLPYVADALDEIEYVTGGIETKWGAERARDGHPKPFALHYVEIGNEDGARGYENARFIPFYDTIKAKYPAMNIIATGPIKTRSPYILDEHLYPQELEMEAIADRYDSHSRGGPKIFVGEWATVGGAPTSCLGAGLADAAWMTGMERNADLIAMSCYAPLLVNVGPRRGRGLIGYDSLNSYGAPSYYAQVMFSRYLGNEVVEESVENTPAWDWQPAMRPGKQTPAIVRLRTIYTSATRDKRAIYLKVVNTAEVPQPVNIRINDASGIAGDGTLVVLSSAKRTDSNTITQPMKITPVTSKISGLGIAFTRTFAPYSVNVVQLTIE